MSDSWRNRHLVDTLMACHHQQQQPSRTCTCIHHHHRRRNFSCTTSATSATTNTTTSNTRGSVLRLLHCYPRRCHPLPKFFILLLVSSCLLTAVTCKPVQQKMDNPCKFNMGSVSPSDKPLDSNSAEAKRFYRQIVQQTKRSEVFNKDLLDRYVHALGDNNFQEMFKSVSYDWLPKLPEDTDESMEKATIESTLKNFFAHLQHYAIALEQVLDDQVRYEGDFIPDVADIQSHLRSLRCELHTAILKLGVSRLEDVKPEVMPLEARKIERPLDRNVRDYVILRDYNKAVQYLRKFFQKQQS